MNPDVGPFPFRILYVDDDANLASLYSDLFRARGYQVHIAHSGFEALADLRQSLPDLVISDLRMPGMSGLELLAILRHRFPNLPLMAVSSGDILSTAALTADGTVSRGEAAIQELYDLAGRLIRQSVARRPAAAASPALPWLPCQPQTTFRLTCGECLRSFGPLPEPLALADPAGVHTVPCTHCGHPQPFLVGESKAA